jgi:Copper type II ascorbate-dependent monooxygenase, C-terminal domain
MHWSRTLGAGCLTAALIITACKKEGNESTVSETATFDLIQDSILTTQCSISGCHASTSDGTYAQHGLVLAKGQAYDNLVARASKNAAAAAQSIIRVKPFDAENSFLYHKITCQANHHTGNFGSKMPMGGRVLTKGQVELIRRWINAGAPKTGKPVDASVLDDKSACQPEVTPLAAPAAGEGFQLRIDPFDIAKQFERELFVRQNTPNTTPVFVNRLVMRGGSNSHHFLVYSFRNQTGLPAVGQIRDIRNPDGTINLITLAQMQNHVFFGGTMEADKEVTLPPGVALRLNASTPLDLNAHYFNKTDLTLKGVNYVNFYTVPQSSVQFEAKTLDLNNQDIPIPAGQRVTFKKTFTFNTVTRIIQLTSHTHKLGEKFVIRIAGGPRNNEIVYENTDWEHPLIKTFTTPITLQPGEGLMSEVTYFNNSSKAVSFGLTSEDEMNIIFGYYY